MARSPKIRKKKSFMFTTKHHSFTGVMGVVLFVFAFEILITSILNSYSNKGQVDVSFGYYGFLTALLNVIGIIAGILGIRERDAFKVCPLIAIVGNGLTLLAWAVLIILGMST